jgi:hypothetical protein
LSRSTQLHGVRDLGLLQSTACRDTDKVMEPESGQLGPTSEFEPDITVAGVKRISGVVVHIVTQTEVCMTKKRHFDFKMWKLRNKRSLVLFRALKSTTYAYHM